jgi:hypothetical protein
MKILFLSDVCTVVDDPRPGIPFGEGVHHRHPIFLRSASRGASRRVGDIAYHKFQSKINFRAGEVKILDYQTQVRRIQNSIRYYYLTSNIVYSRKWLEPLR